MNEPSSIAMAGGRLTIYKLENTEMARQACMFGATDDALAGRFEVCRRTIDNWIATIPEFSKLYGKAARSRMSQWSRRCSRAPRGWSKR
jgi:hypothetical protein